VVFGAIGVAVLAMLVLHLTAAGRLDPVTTTVSDYVSVPGGSALLAWSTLAIAVATAVVALGLVRLRMSGAALLFGLAALVCWPALLFPPTRWGRGVRRHRVAPVCGWVVLRQSAGGRAVDPASAAGSRGLLVDRAQRVAGIAFLVSHIPLVFPGWPVRGSGGGGAAWLAERGLLLVDLALVAVAGRRVLR